MKKLLFVISSLFLMSTAFAQNEENSIRFENRKQEGYFNTTQTGMLMGNRKLAEQSYYYYADRNKLQVAPSITMTNGYMFNEKVAIGIGVGFEILDHNHFPVFVDIRRTLWDNKASPFFALKIGHAIGNFKKKHYDNLYLDWGSYNNVDFRNYGGFMLHPEIGVKIPLSENADLMFTVAYRYQKTKVKVTSKDYSYSNEWEHKESLNRMSFGAAIMFR